MYSIPAPPPPVFVCMGACARASPRESAEQQRAWFPQLLDAESAHGDLHERQRLAWVVFSGHIKYDLVTAAHL